MAPLTLLCASDPTYDEDLPRYLASNTEFEVITARTGATALEHVSRGDVDILLYGRDLPDTNADDLLRRARWRDALLPAILLTAGESTTNAEECDPPPTAVVQMQRPDAHERVHDRITGIVRFVRSGEVRPLEGYDRDVLNRVTDGFYALDDEWRFSYLNERAEAILQRPAAELIGRNIWNAFPEAVGTIAYEEFTRAKETGERAEFETYYEPLESWLRVTAYPSPEGLSIYLRDVTDDTLRMRAMDAASVGILITDPHRPDNPIIYANEGFEALTGYRASDVRGHNCRFLQGPRTRAEPVRRMRNAIDSGESTEVEILNYRKNGTPFWNQVRITPVFDPTGELTHFVGFQQDVTDRVEKERRAALLDRVLRHNLRNNLNVVLGHVEDLEEAVQLDPEHVAPIVEHCENLLRVAERARDVDALLEDERFEPNPVSLEQLVSDAIDSTHRAYPNAEITTRIGSDLSVVAPDALTVALEELLKNAIEHADRASSVTVAAEAETRQFPPEGVEKSVVRVSVLDAAPRLADQERAVLIGDVETPLRHGSGLGLWLVQWIVTMAGGCIDVTDRAIGGNEITVTLPAADSPNRR